MFADNIASRKEDRGQLEEALEMRINLMARKGMKVSRIKTVFMQAGRRARGWVGGETTRKDSEEG